MDSEQVLRLLGLVSHLVIGVTARMAVAVTIAIAVPVAVGARFDIEDRPAAGTGSATADIKSQQRFGDPTGGLEMVIVRQFFAGVNCPTGEDINASIIVQSFAIGIAGVIDIAGIVAADSAVNGGRIIDRKEEGMMAFHRLFVVSFGLESRADPLTDILDDPLTLADSGERERAPSLDAGLTDNE